MTPCCGCCHFSGWFLAGGPSKDLAKLLSPHTSLPAGPDYEDRDTKKTGKGLSSEGAVSAGEYLVDLGFCLVAILAQWLYAGVIKHLLYTQHA